ncbi:hypothetical protein H5T88_06705 [bacterium]|nr:hypothetical protein [bacterium]
MQITIPFYNDPYLDNALLYFHKLLDDLHQQFPDAVDTQLNAYGLDIAVLNRERFIEVLENSIKQITETNLQFTREDKRGGTKVQKWKHYLPFRPQPPAQFPLTYREEERRELLEKAFPSEQPRGKNTCFLCGGFPAQVELTQGIYPFVTKAASLTTSVYLVKRGKKTYYSVCPLCYLIASLGWADPSLPYRSRVEIAPKQTVSFLWLPYPASSPYKLQSLKNRLSTELARSEETSNVKLPTLHSPPSRFSLLLTFLENLLQKVAEREVKSLQEVALIIPEEWWLLRIPEGSGMKNVDFQGFYISKKVKDALVECVQSDLKPYSDLLGLIVLRNVGEGKFNTENGKLTNNLREELSRSFLQDDYTSFARRLQPNPRWIPFVPKNLETNLFNFIKIWRCNEMLTEHELEILRKAGRTIALISDLRNKPSVLYNFLDRVRTSSDLLSSLKEIGHLLAGIDFAETKAQFLSPDSLSELVNMVNKKETIFQDLLSTLGIFISVEYAKMKLQERRKTQDEK